MRNLIKRFAPRFIFHWYHLTLAFLGALIYGRPSRKFFVLGVSGTKGKTSVIEIINAILEEAGFKTSLSDSLRFKIDKNIEKNLFKMTMPGRFFLQKFLKKAVEAGSRYVLIEVTSEGILQSRHKFIEWDAALFTNLHPEHIEAHGSFENYKRAKLAFFQYLKKSRKDKKTIIVNGDDENAEYFLKVPADEKYVYGIRNKELGIRDKYNYSLLITRHSLLENGIDFTLEGQELHSNLIGEFNLYNILAAIVFCRSQNIDWPVIKKALEKFKGIPGRMEFVQKEPFSVAVDYAHTPDSLEQVYRILQGGATSRGGRTSRLMCVLGACGGGRDKWKRPEMGKIAAQNCDVIILTNEDPYDEDPQEILNQIEKGVLEFVQNQDRFSRKDIKIRRILDRREAIKESLKDARTGDAVVITGKGAEPWLMGPRGSKIPWDDRAVVKEELKKLQQNAKT